MTLQQIYAVRQGVSGPKSNELDTFSSKDELIAWLTSKIMLEVRGREEQSLTFPVTIVKWLCNDDADLQDKELPAHSLPATAPAEIPASAFEQAVATPDVITTSSESP